MSNPPLILLPGLLTDARLWRHQAATLADLACPVVADVTGADTLEALAAQVLADAPPRFALAGLSMGGYVALEIMRRAPERVTKLALVDTTARPDTAEQTERRLALINLAQHGKFKAVMPRLLPNLVHPDRLEDEALIALVLDMAEQLGKDAFIRQQQAIMTRPDGRLALAAIACPTLVLYGRQDLLTPTPLQEEMAGMIPGARLVAVEDAAHLSPVEQPQAVSAVLRYWLQSSDGGTSRGL